jgi:hypothetical protein
MLTSLPSQPIFEVTLDISFVLGNACDELGFGDRRLACAKMNGVRVSKLADDFLGDLLNCYSQTCEHIFDKPSDNCRRCFRRAGVEWGTRIVFKV